MAVRTRGVGNNLVIDVQGQVDLHSSPRMRSAILEGINRKEVSQVAVNLSGVSYIDSSGLGELVSSYATVTNQGGSVKLLNVQKRVHDLLQITKLYTVFEVFTDETEAIATFSRPRRDDWCVKCTA